MVMTSLAAVCDFSKLGILYPVGALTEAVIYACPYLGTRPRCTELREPDAGGSTEHKSFLMAFECYVLFHQQQIQQSTSGKQRQSVVHSFER